MKLVRISEGWERLLKTLLFFYWVSQHSIFAIGNYLLTETDLWSRSQVRSPNLTIDATVIVG